MIKVSSIKFNNELRTSQNLSFLMACIGLKIYVTLEFYYEDIHYANEGSAITINPALKDINLSDNTGVILCEDASTFKNTEVGDSIGACISGAYTYGTVTEKYGNGMIRTTLSGAVLQELQYSANDFIFNCTPFNGHRYAYNLIDSGNSYNSLIDGEYQELIKDGLVCSNTTPVSMNFTGLKSYQIGSATIVGVGGVGNTGAVSGQFYKQQFKIIHSLTVTPLFLTSQYADLLAGIKPEYFTANKCLNYISQLQLGRNLNNPNGIQTLQVPNTLSNIGWFGETFNGGQTNYSISSVTLKDGTTTITHGLEFDKDITVEILVNNTTDSPFSNFNTKYIFGFNYLPESDTYIENTGENQTTNYLIDSKLNTLGLGAANGDNYNTTMQVIKKVTSTYISTSQMKITATINVGTAAKTILQQGDFSRYAMWVITENHSLADLQSDTVPLLASVSEFYVQTINSDLINSTGVKFIQHPGSTISDGVDGLDLDSFPVDDIVALLPFNIDYRDSVARVVGVYAYNAVSNLVGTNNALILVDNTNSVTIGVADYAVSNSNTLNLLMSSINTNTALGAIFGGAPAFSNAIGYTAQRIGDYLYIYAPAKGVAYNGVSYTLTRTDASGSSSTLFGGVDEVDSYMTNQGCKIKKIQSKFILKDSAAVETDITLEDFSFSTAAYPIVAGKAQSIDYSQDRVYKIPSSIRKTITCDRDYTSDTTDIKYFEYSYPFMMRWEYWKPYSIPTPPIGIFDSAKPSNGLNYFWQRYSTITTWKLYYDVIFTIEQNGDEFTQTISTELKDTKDFEGNTEYVGNSIKSYDITTLAEIVNGGTKYVKGYENTKIVAKFIKTSGYLPTASEFGIHIWIHVYEKGGDNSITEISSYYDKDTQSWFKSIDLSDNVVIAKSSNEYTGTCLLDYTKLPNDATYTIYARMYEKYSADAKQFMNGDIFEFMDGTIYEFM